RERAAEPGLVLLVRRRMTGGAAAGMKHGSAVVEIHGTGSELARRQRFRDRQNPENPGAKSKENHNCESELAEHSPPLHAFAAARPLLGAREEPVSATFIPERPGEFARLNHIAGPRSQSSRQTELAAFRRAEFVPARA